MSDRASFDGIAPALAERFQVITVDLPGFGGSVPVIGGLGAVADRMAGFVEAVAGGAPAIVLGNGYGGFVTLQMAIRRPDLVTRLVLSDCGARFSEPGREAFRNMAAAAEAKGLDAIAEVAMRRLFAPAFQQAHPALVADRRAAFLKTDMATFHQACLTLAALDLTGELHTVPAPTLVMIGEQDEATPMPMSVALSEGLPKASLTVLPGCAHVPTCPCSRCPSNSSTRFPVSWRRPPPTTASDRHPPALAGMPRAGEKITTFRRGRPTCRHLRLRPGDPSAPRRRSYDHDRRRPPRPMT